MARSLASLPSASFEIVPKSVQWEREQGAALVFGSQLPWLLDDARSSCWLTSQLLLLILITITSSAV